MSYEHLQAIGDVAGVVSRGLAPSAVAALPTAPLAALRARGCGGCGSAPHACTICMADFEEEGESATHKSRTRARAVRPPHGAACARTPWQCARRASVAALAHPPARPPARPPPRGRHAQAAAVRPRLPPGLRGPVAGREQGVPRVHQGGAAGAAARRGVSCRAWRSPFTHPLAAAHTARERGSRPRQLASIPPHRFSSACPLQCAAARGAAPSRCRRDCRAPNACNAACRPRPQSHTAPPHSHACAPAGDPPASPTRCAARCTRCTSTSNSNSNSDRFILPKVSQKE